MTASTDFGAAAQRKCKCRWCRRAVRMFDAAVAAEMAKCGWCAGRGHNEIRGEYNVDQETCKRCKGTGNRK